MKNANEWLEIHQSTLDSLPTELKERTNEQHESFKQIINGTEYICGVDIANGEDRTAYSPL